MEMGSATEWGSHSLAAPYSGPASGRAGGEPAATPGVATPSETWEDAPAEHARACTECAPPAAEIVARPAKLCVPSGLEEGPWPQPDRGRVGRLWRGKWARLEPPLACPPSPTAPSWTTRSRPAANFGKVVHPGRTCGGFVCPSSHVSWMIGSSHRGCSVWWIRRRSRHRPCPHLCVRCSPSPNPRRNGLPATLREGTEGGVVRLRLHVILPSDVPRQLGVARRLGLLDLALHVGVGLQEALHIRRNKRRQEPPP